MGKKKTEQRFDDFQKKQEIVKLQKFYVNSQLDNLDELVDARKKEIEEELIAFKNEHSDMEDIPPYILSNYFFKSVTSLQNIEPKYSSEHLAILWELYSYMVEQVNLKLCEFTPRLTHFCKFIGITASTFKNMLKSPDENVKFVATKIKDACYDNGVIMAQLEKHNTRATLYRMKSELEVTEKAQPKEINVKMPVDLEKINKRIEELKNFNNKTIDCVNYSEK